MRKNFSKDDDQPTPAWKKLFNLDDIESLLQSVAAEGKALSYAETLNRLGMDFSRPKMRALCSALTEIDRRARRKKQPELAVLVVRASDRIPGQGWWVERDDDGYNGPWEGSRALAYIRGIQARTFNYWRKKRQR